VHPEPFRRRKQRRAGAIVALFLTLALHALFLGLFLLLGALEPHHPHPEAPQSVTMRTLSETDWARNRGDKVSPRDDDVQPPKLAQEPKPEPPKPPDKNPKGQVVDVAPGNDQPPPDDAKYLAEHNNKVEHETKSKEQTPFYRNAMPHRTTTSPTPQTGHDAAERQMSKGNGGLAHDDRPLAQANPKHGALEVPDVKPRQEVALKAPDKGQGPGLKVPNTPQSDALHGNSSRLNMQQGAPGTGAQTDPSLGSAGSPGVANLMPSQATMDKLAGAAPNDKLDADEGDGTFLNTREWKYASFFNRVKQAVGLHWNPDTVLRQRDPTGEIYGGKDRRTLLQVTLTDRGMVKEIHVDQTCGVDFLDQEAIAAFERAQPFPNPPGGLIDSDGAVHFQFGFFLEASSFAHLRLFRPQQ
jgi:TonB family protein